jgi:hypothetical protein
MTTPPHRALRICCVVYGVLLIVTHFVASSEGAALPPELHAWQLANPLPNFYALGGSGCVIALLVATGALLKGKRWALYLHVASIALWIAFGSSAGPIVSAGLSSPLVSALFVVAGMIYGLAFFSPALERPEDEGTD